MFVRLNHGYFLSGFVISGLAILSPVLHGAPIECGQDDRCTKLKSFFKKHGSPLHAKAAAFLEAADQHKLDWRLLPGIAMVETSGGKHGRPKNVFGWNSGRTGFKSVEAGIQYVAGRFERSPIYRGRTALGILKAYNPARRQYPTKVIRFMQQLTPDPVQ
jgi:hypothetical protein